MKSVRAISQCLGTTGVRPVLACLVMGAALVGGCAPQRKPTPATPRAGVTLEQMRTARSLAQQAQREAIAGHTEEAIELYRQALQTWNRVETAWNNLGKLLQEQGNFAAAAEAFQVAADQSPGDPRPVENLGVLWAQRGYHDEALTQFDEALRRDPRSIVALRGAVRSAHMLQLADEDTLEHIKKALMLETDPTWLKYLERQRYRVEQELDY